MTCPTCGTKTRRKGYSVRPYLTTGPTWFCKAECARIEPPRLLEYVDNRTAPGA